MFLGYQYLGQMASYFGGGLHAILQIEMFGGHKAK